MIKKIDLSLNDKIKNILFDIEEEIVEIQLLTEIKPIDYMGVKIEGGKKDDKIRVPRYYAYHLLENNSCKLIGDEIYNIVFNEFKKQQLPLKLFDLPENLLLKVIGMLGLYSYKSDRYSPVKSNVDEKRLREAFMNLSNERLKRILKDLLVNDYKKIERNLDPLEKPVIEQISQLMQEYLQIISNE